MFTGLIGLLINNQRKRIIKGNQVLYNFNVVTIIQILYLCKVGKLWYNILVKYE